MRRLLLVALLLSGAFQTAQGQTHGADPIEVPLREHAGRLVVPVFAPDGTELQFILSTGTGVTVLSQSTSSDPGLRQGLTLGGHPVHMDGAQTLPDEALTEEGMLFAGMIGPSTLNQFDMLVDLPNSRLVLKPIGPSVVWEGIVLSEPVRLRVLHGIILSLDVEMNGTSYPAMLDLGTPTLIVNQGVQEDGNLRSDGSNTLVLGNRTFTEIPAEFQPLPIFERFSPTGAGFVLVGNPMVRGCALAISWVHRELRTCAP